MGLVVFSSTPGGPKAMAEFESRAFHRHVGGYATGLVGITRDFAIIAATLTNRMRPDAQELQQTRFETFDPEFKRRRSQVLHAIFTVI